MWNFLNSKCKTMGPSERKIAGKKRDSTTNGKKSRNHCSHKGGVAGDCIMRETPLPQEGGPVPGQPTTISSINRTDNHPFVSMQAKQLCDNPSPIINGKIHNAHVKDHKAGFNGYKVGVVNTHNGVTLPGTNNGGNRVIKVDKAPVHHGSHMGFPRTRPPLLMPEHNRQAHQSFPQCQPLRYVPSKYQSFNFQNNNLSFIDVKNDSTCVNKNPANLSSIMDINGGSNVRSLPQQGNLRRDQSKSYVAGQYADSMAQSADNVRNPCFTNDRMVKKSRASSDRLTSRNTRSNSYIPSQLNETYQGDDFMDLTEKATDSRKRSLDTNHRLSDLDRHMLGIEEIISGMEHTLLDTTETTHIPKSGDDQSKYSPHLSSNPRYNVGTINQDKDQGIMQFPVQSSPPCSVYTAKYQLNCDVHPNHRLESPSDSSHLMAPSPGRTLLLPSTDKQFHLQDVSLTPRASSHTVPVDCHLSVQGQAIRSKTPPGGGRRFSRAMEKYENLGLVGEGSYGMVLKCKHKETGQYVAIKKFLESEDDKMVKKIAMREVRMLKQLRHENLVNLIEVFRRKKRLYLVFEFVDHTVLDDLEKCSNGLDEGVVRKVSWQVLKGIEFCHLHNIIHRDIKPENILVSRTGIVKLCDFGFARTLAQPGETYTDYVATRWYRAPELLVGDTKYGRAVDIWAIGCLLVEMLTGEPLFPGDSDIDQLFHIVKCFGNLTQRHREVFHKNPLFVGMRLPEASPEVEPLERKFPRISKLAIDLMKQCLQLDANDRPTCSQLLRHDFFTKDGFAQRFQQELKGQIQKENQNNPLLSHHGRNSTKGQSGKENGHSDNVENKKKKKEKKETKDSSEEKPKRKLPDPDKFVKKTPPPASNPTQGAPVASTSTTPSKAPPVNDAEEYSEPPTPTAYASPSSMPPIQSGGTPAISSTNLSSSPTLASIHNLYFTKSVLTTSNQGGGPPPLRVNDKMKKVPPGYHRKGPAPNHHSSNLASTQPILQTEKTSLHEKTLHYDKMTNPKRWGSQQDARDRKDDRGGFLLPEVKGAEANPYRTGPGKNKKNYMATVPHITNIDPFSDNHSPSSSPDRESSSLPSV